MHGPYDCDGTTVHTKTINGILGKKTEQGHQITTNLETIGHSEVSLWDLRPKLQFCISALQSNSPHTCMREQRGISSLNEVRRQALKALQPLRSAPATEVTTKDKAGFKLAPTPTHSCTAQDFATGVQWSPTKPVQCNCYSALMAASPPWLPAPHGPAAWSHKALCTGTTSHTHADRERKETCLFAQMRLDC